MHKIFKLIWTNIALNIWSSYSDKPGVIFSRMIYQIWVKRKLKTLLTHLRMQFKMLCCSRSKLWVVLLDKFQDFKISEQTWEPLPSFTIQMLICIYIIYIYLNLGKQHYHFLINNRKKYGTAKVQDLLSIFRIRIYIVGTLYRTL